MDKNLYEWTRGRKTPPPESEVKEHIRALLIGLDHMHRNGIFHRDIKPENILLQENRLKIADFGSCKGMYSKQPYTEYISTRWYRSPECLLTDGYYSFKMDLWGVGCVFFEILALFPLFPGKNELDQIARIHNVLGTPAESLQKKFQAKATHMEVNFPAKSGTGFEKMIAHASSPAKDLISKLLKYNEQERYSAQQALNHPYFESPETKTIKLLPTLRSTRNISKKSVVFPPLKKKQPAAKKLNDSKRFYSKKSLSVDEHDKKIVKQQHAWRSPSTKRYFFKSFY
jgi:renal tumor antigen